MSNKIPIDDLFREVLSEGKEQLNLGAWANMERMLNGQNPYAGDENESKRKRRILPFMVIFLLLSTAVTAGFLWLHKKDNTAQNLSQPITKTTSTPITASSTLPSITENGDVAAEIPQNIKPVHTQQASLNENKSNKKNTNSHSIMRKSHKKTSAAIAMNATNEVPVKENIKADRHQKQVKDGFKMESVAQKQFEVANNEDPTAPVETEKPKTKKTTKVAKTIANQILIKNRDGSIKNIAYDTIEKSTVEIEKNIPENYLVVDDVSKNKNYKYHPRYLGAHVDAEETPIVLDNVLHSGTETIAKTPSLSVIDEKEKRKKKSDKPNAFDAIGAFTSLALNKIGNASSEFFSFFKVFDPGLSMGVNAALFNTQHNYGGFHAGLTNHTAISETFSIFTELKFFIRNNAGFTINDIKTQLLNKSVDTTVQGQTTYSYQVDSLTKKYNFKSFMSLELPLMLNAKFNNLSVYAGPNFVYNFKLKINEIDKKYVVDRSDVITNGTPYSYPAEKGMKFVKDDFCSRFGIGYSVGVSYNFNPKIYVDLRMSKVVWDNTKTNSQREISNGVMKVPFTQLSLGYKFLNK